MLSVRIYRKSLLGVFFFPSESVDLALTVYRSSLFLLLLFLRQCPRSSLGGGLGVKLYRYSDGRVMCPASIFNVPSVILKIVGSIFSLPSDPTNPKKKKERNVLYRKGGDVTKLGLGWIRPTNLVYYHQYISVESIEILGASRTQTIRTRKISHVGICCGRCW